MAMDDDERAMRDRALAAIRVTMDGAELEDAQAQGGGLDLTQALELALEASSPATVPP